MQQRLRKILARSTAPIRLGVREFMDRRALQQLPGQRTDASALRPLDPTDLMRRLEDVDIAQDWHTDLESLRQVNPPIYASGVNPGDQRALYTIVRSLRSAHILEIGTHIGSSTLAMALASRRNSQNGSSSYITTIDIRDVNDEGSRPWEFFGSDAPPRKKLRQLGLEKTVNFLIGDSLKLLPTMKQKFDLIFLDGNHRAPIVYQEIPAAIDCLAHNGILVMHDVFPGGRRLWNSRPTPGPWQAVSRLLAETKDLNLLPLGELPWPTKSGSRVTSLAVLSRAPS